MQGRKRKGVNHGEAQYIKHLFDNEDMTKSEIAQKTGYTGKEGL